MKGVMSLPPPSTIYKGLGQKLFSNQKGLDSKFPLPSFVIADVQLYALR